MKYLACDLDGTLVHDEEISKEDREAILKLQEKGYKFIVSTGRSKKGVETTFNNYPELKYDYLVASNGALVIDGEGNVIYENYIESDMGQDLIKDFMNEPSMCVHYEHDNKNYLLDPKNTDDIQEMVDYFDTIVSEEDLFSEKRNYTLISFFARDKSYDRAENTKNKIVKKYEGKLEAFRNQYFIDIAPLKCSKGNGLEKVLEIEKASTDRLYAIGDSFNDVSMFKLTENSFTFKEAEQELKEKANNHVNSVNECIEYILR